MGFADDDRALVLSIAVEHLGPEVAATWAELLRPALRLVPAAGTAVVARLGGSPRLGPGQPWPGVDHGRPVAYVGELRCDGISALAADVPVPDHGRLLFFFSDDSDFSAHDSYPASGEVFRTAVLHVGGADGGTAHPTPPGLPARPETEWSAVPTWTAPGWEDPVLEQVFRSPGMDDDAWRQHPVRSLELYGRLDARHCTDEEHAHHQLGGIAMPLQGPVEAEARWQVANRAALRGETDPGAGATLSLVLQLDGGAVAADEEVDMGMLYWLADRADLAGGRTSAVSFVWQT